MKNNPFQLVVLAAISLLSACSGSSDALFTKLSESDTKIKFKNTLFEDGPLNVANYVYFYNGGGVAVGDINNDGLQDILFTGNMVRNRLYLNKGNMQFEDITEKSGVDALQGWCTGATMADVNQDGLLDIYICRSADINPEMRRNLLFINNGDLTFKEKAEEFGLADKGYSTQAAFFDYDKDNDLDCFIINHSLQKYTAGVQDNPELRKEHNSDYSSKLYRNDGGHYTDVTEAAGITSNVLTFGLGIAIADFNKDGWPDVAVSNDFNEPDYLFMNNGNGSFTEQLSKAMDHISLYSMGSDAADYNNDGWIDLMTLDMMPESNHTIKMHSGPENFDKFNFLFNQGFYYQYSRNMLQKNNGDGTFSEVGQQAGVSNTDWSWSALFGDYDNDGHKDLFVTNGYVKDYTEMDFLKYSVDRVVRSMAKDSVDPIPEYLRKMPTIQIPNYIYKNNGKGGFEKKTTEWGFDDKGVSAGAAYADLDNDGDLDLIINNSNELSSIYRNNQEKTTKNNSLRINLKGPAGNSRGIGAKVNVYTKNGYSFQEQSPVRGFQSSSDPVLVFGLDKQATADSVTIVWPDNKKQTIVAPKANADLVINYADAKDLWTPTAMLPSMFAVSEIPESKHVENQFNDFTLQGLLPYYFSRQGPCIATGDVNGDGRDDFYQGGARGQAGQIFIQLPDGNFKSMHSADFNGDAAMEDVAASMFDADKDGDLDLYVASGGLEVSEKDPSLQDRLYLNDGKGKFTKKQDALPLMYTSKSCVKPADVDNDGDLDVFVGGRMVPGFYPNPARSYLLINDGKGKFTDEIQTRCPELTTPGMVTDALWMQLNKDAYPDLVLIGEWMPVMAFVNQSGKLQNQSQQFFPFYSNGWWSRMAAADMDGDGDQDLVIGNCGTNTQFHVKEKEPMSLYYDDFDGNGSVDPILCYFIDGVSYPAASRDDLTDQLPLLKKKFLEYKSYADATIKDIFTEEQLKDVTVLTAGQMESGYLQNNGDKGFSWTALPQEAQTAPVFGIVLEDFDKDGKMDILLGGNNTWSRIKFGRYTANHGIVLKGNGKGGFEYQTQTQSGLCLRGNLRALQAVKTAKGLKLIAGMNDSPSQLLSVH